MTAVTYQELFDRNACDLREWWLDTYGPDAVVEIDKALADCPKDDWVVWLAGKRHPALGFVWAGMAMRWADIAAYADTVTEENWLAARDAAFAAARIVRADNPYAADADADDYAAEAAETAGVRHAERAAAAAHTAAIYADADASAWSEMRTVAEAWLRAGGRPG